MRPLAAARFALVLAILGLASPTPADPPAGEAAAPPVATPSPQATPKQVEDAKTTAKAAGLTPLVPSPENPLHPAFQLYLEVDLPILGTGLVFAGARLVHGQPAYCAPLCDPSTLNALDRTTAGYWSPAWQNASNVGLVAIGLSAATLLFLDEGLMPGLNDSVVIAESALGGVALASMLTLAAGRPRPFLYGEKAPLSTRNGPDAGLSYLSSHAVASFAIAASTFVTMRRLHPGKKVAWVVLGVGAAMATFVAVSRVMSGMHFITDAAGGAVVGISVGILVPSLHGSPVSIVPMAGEGRKGAALSLRF